MNDFVDDHKEFVSSLNLVCKIHTLILICEIVLTFHFGVIQQGVGLNEWLGYKDIILDFILNLLI